MKTALISEDGDRPSMFRLDCTTAVFKDTLSVALEGLMAQWMSVIRPQCFKPHPV
jgi:hypothetical protein